MRVLFWNVQKKQLEDTVAKLAATLDIDLVVLIESQGINPAKQVEALSKMARHSFCYHPFPTNKEFKFFSRFAPTCFEALGDSGHLAAMSVQLPITKSLTFIAVHSQSRIYWNQPGDRFTLALRIRACLDEVEEQTMHDRTCLLGDFNTDPFDAALTSSDTLNATMCSKVASKISRKVAAKSHKFLYNPMWSLLGDISPGPPGTLHYYQSVSSCNYWYAFDQVLLRPSLIEFFEKSELRIVESVEGLSLAKLTGEPDDSIASDHFPIVFELNTESEALLNV